MGFHQDKASGTVFKEIFVMIGLVVIFAAFILLGNSNLCNSSNLEDIDLGFKDNKDGTYTIASANLCTKCTVYATFNGNAEFISRETECFNTAGEAIADYGNRGLAGNSGHRNK